MRYSIFQYFLFPVKSKDSLCKDNEEMFNKRSTDSSKNYPLYDDSGIDHRNGVENKFINYWTKSKTSNSPAKKQSATSRSSSRNLKSGQTFLSFNRSSQSNAVSARNNQSRAAPSSNVYDSTNETSKSKYNRISSLFEGNRYF